MKSGPARRTSWLPSRCNGSRKEQGNAALASLHGLTVAHEQLDSAVDAAGDEENWVAGMLAAHRSGACGHRIRSTRWGRGTIAASVRRWRAKLTRSLQRGAAFYRPERLAQDALNRRLSTRK